MLSPCCIINSNNSSILSVTQPSHSFSPILKSTELTSHRINSQLQLLQHENRLSRWEVVGYECRIRSHWEKKWSAILRQIRPARRGGRGSRHSRRYSVVLWLRFVFLVEKSDVLIPNIVNFVFLSASTFFYSFYSLLFSFFWLVVDGETVVAREYVHDAAVVVGMIINLRPAQTDSDLEKTKGSFSSRSHHITAGSPLITILFPFLFFSIL